MFFFFSCFTYNNHEQTEIDSKTEIPTNALTTEAQNWINSLGVNYKTVDEILEAGPCPKVLKAIQEGIDRANKQSISNAQKIQKFAILPRDFSVATGELGKLIIKFFFVSVLNFNIIFLKNFFINSIL